MNSTSLNIQARYTEKNKKKDLNNNLQLKPEICFKQSNLLSNNQEQLENKNKPKKNVAENRKVLFEYPSLPEIKFCFLVVICTLIYAWYCVFQASQRWAKFRLSENVPLKEFPFFGKRFKVLD